MHSNKLQCDLFHSREPPRWPAMITECHEKRGKLLPLNIRVRQKKKQSKKKVPSNTMRIRRHSECTVVGIRSCLVGGIGSWQLSDNAQNFTRVFHLIRGALMSWQSPQKFRSSLCFTIHFHNHFGISLLCFICCYTVVFFSNDWIW